MARLLNGEKERTLLGCRVPSQELPHEAGDLVAVFLQGEVAGVEQMILDILQIPLVRLGPAGGKMVSFLPHTIRVGG
jgi:hypothetical protein